LAIFLKGAVHPYPIFVVSFIYNAGSIQKKRPSQARPIESSQRQKNWMTAKEITILAIQGLKLLKRFLYLKRSCSTIFFLVGLTHILCCNQEFFPSNYENPLNANRLITFYRLCWFPAL